MATAKKTKKTSTQTSAPTQVAAPVAAQTVMTPMVAAAPAKSVTPAAPVTAPVAAPKNVSVAPVVAAPVVAAPVVAAPVVVAPAVAAPMNGPVAVQLQKDPKNGVTATIRYAGTLKDADRVLVRLGLEWTGGPRWQQGQEVALVKTPQGALEAVVRLAGQDQRGTSLAALQLAFSTADHSRWDNAGVPFGYYQVNAADGRVLPVNAPAR